MARRRRGSARHCLDRRQESGVRRPNGSRARCCAAILTSVFWLLTRIFSRLRANPERWILNSTRSRAPRAATKSLSRSLALQRAPDGGRLDDMDEARTGSRQRPGQWTKEELKNGALPIGVER